MNKKLAKHKLSKNLLKSETWLIDGGNGSEIINLTKFATADFGALTAYKYPKAVEEVHKNYADAGANFITVNTYSANYNILNAIGYGDDCEDMIKQAIDRAKKSTSALENTFITGSISEHPPHDSNGKVCWPCEEQEILNFEKTLVHLFDQNIDCLFLELIRTEMHGLRLTKALTNVWKKLVPSKKCPVFLCVVPQFKPTTNELIFQQSEAQKTGRNSETYQELTFSKNNIEMFINSLSEIDLIGVNVMHCTFESVSPAVEILKSAWDGPIGVYPQHGYWEYPEWICTPVDYVKAKGMLQEWVSLGVNLYGGCCGTTPELIKFFQKELATEQ